MTLELIKSELYKNVDALVNEIDLTIDYFDKRAIALIRKFINRTRHEKQFFDLFVNDTKTHLNTYETQISAVLFSSKKLKAEYYNFLNEISLFGHHLKFSVFENESKNTKKALVKYIYSIWMSCTFVSTNSTTDSLNPGLTPVVSGNEIAGNEDIVATENLQRKLEEFISHVKEEANKLEAKDIKTGIKIPKGQRKVQKPQESPGPKTQKPFKEAIAENKDIFEIAQDISEKLQKSKMDPAMMLGQLLSGNIQNGPLNELVENIQQTVEAKIKSGNLNQTDLEAQAKNLLQSFGNGSLI